jgi:hypothetical protein
MTTNQILGSLDASFGPMSKPMKAGATLIPDTRRPASEFPQISYDLMPLSDIQVDRVEIEDTGKLITQVRICGQMIRHSVRTTNSLFSFLGQSPSVLTLFDCAEVIQRFLDRKAVDAKNLMVRVATEHVVDARGSYDRLLAITRPEKSIVTPSAMEEILVRRNPYEQFSYSNGIIISRHPSPVTRDTSIKDDVFHTKTFLSMPLDGYGDAAGYTGMLRVACYNGMVAMVKMCRSKFIVGENDPVDTISRLLGTYYLSENVDYLANRLTAASATPASLDEYDQFLDAVGTCHCFSGPRIHRAVGEDDYEKLGIISAGEVLEKRRQKVAMKTISVYDVINAATELATHHSDGFSAVMMNAFVGALLTKEEFDMEGIHEHHGAARPFFFENLSPMSPGSDDPMDSALRQLADAAKN